jgi:hypothetical protein
VLEVAAAGLMSTEAPMPETMKSRLIAIARMDVLRNVFFMLFLNSFVKLFRKTFVIRRYNGNLSIYGFGVRQRTIFAGDSSGLVFLMAVTNYQNTAYSVC